MYIRNNSQLLTKGAEIMQGTFRFSFGPWNIHEGADPFGPEVRNTIPFNEKLAAYKKMGFDGVQIGRAHV